MKQTLRKKYPYLELFWFVFYRIRTENGEISSIQSIRRDTEYSLNMEYLSVFSPNLGKYGQE